MTQSDQSACEHKWENRREKGEPLPLTCYACGALWPGERLPEPYGEAPEGFGDMTGALRWTAGINAIRAMPLEEGCS